MKTCRKCKNEYKEVYEFCPKCGTPYDANKKVVKTPGDVPGSAMSIVKKIINISLYVFGGALILAYLESFAKEPLDAILAILFGLSLFPIFYKLIIDKSNSISIDNIVKIARFALPILILIIWMTASPTTNTKEESSNNSNQSTSIKEEQPQQEEKQEEPVVEEPKEEEKQEEPKTVETVYELKYKLLGDYGKLVEYEGDKEYFYYFPSGNYTIELTRKTGNICFLWIDYNNGYKSDYGTAYNNKEKLSFTQKGEKKEITLTDDVHIYNSNDCNYKLTKKN